MFDNVRDIPMVEKNCVNDSWAAKDDDGITLTWRDLSIYASIPNRGFFSKRAPIHKRIVNNVTGAVKAGSLVALMGPSGAGKSTLMGALAHRNATGVFIDGDIRINGVPVGNYVQKISGFMHQEDLFVGTLTVREHLFFMARLKLDRSKSKSEISKIIDESLTHLGLTNCSNIRIGENGHDKVISGGEKKRLAFATEMLTNPPLLFCDEPTTGLDSYSAQTLVHFMKTMASHGKTIVCTIHQPSSEIFDMFNRIILLTEGRISFIGDTKSALKFFAKHGYSCPANYNPADFFIRTLATTPGSEDSSRMRIKRLCDEFTVSDAGKEVELLVEQEMCIKSTVKEEKTRRMILNANWKEPLWATKFYWLTYRSFLQVIRDPSVQAVRILQKLAIALTAGLCYVGSVEDSQTGVQSVQGAVFLFVTENTFPGMYAVLALFPLEKPLFMREYRNGLYSTHAYYVSKMASLLPGLIVEPVLFITVCYWITGLRDTFYAFFMTAFVTILTMNVATACGCFFSNAFDSMSVALACLVPFDYLLMITSGIFIKLDSMPDIIGWFRYLSWFMYSNEAMTILQWEDVKNITCEYNNPDIPCLKTGVDVLEKYDFAFSHFSQDIVAMISMYLIFHVLAYICLWWKANKNK